jgi:flagellin-specific chaperone FliS
MPQMTIAHAAEYYFKMHVETASHRKAIYLLHERCVFCLMKCLFVSHKKSDAFIGVQNILSHLQWSLTLNDTISKGLFYLYDYCSHCLSRGNDRDIASALEILTILRDTFKKLLKRP